MKFQSTFIKRFALDFGPLVVVYHMDQVRPSHMI
ncbi:hypothetical protein M0802_014849 [Mischocyttarus mexicanus]|nr:hypothetical protein M0802_014849 [Mischocyttarus mexicanus]